MTKSSVAHVLIVGGGFAGVACAKGLRGENDIRVTIFDKNGVHQFQPLLYQVATAELTPDDVAFDLDEIFARPGQRRGPHRGSRVGGSACHTR